MAGKTSRTRTGGSASIASTYDPGSARPRRRGRDTEWVRDWSRLRRRMAPTVSEFWFDGYVSAKRKPSQRA